MNRGREPRAAVRGAPRAASGSQRPLRVGEALRHALAKALRENSIHDVALAKHNITVAEVRMSPDLRHANIFIVPFGGADAAPVLADLKRTAPRLRHVVAAELQLRFAPELHFLLDTSFDYAAGITRVLSSPEVAQDLAADEADAAEDE